MATTETASGRRVSSVFDLAGKSVQLVRNNWQMFAVVNILGLLSGLLALVDSDRDREFSAGVDFLGLSNSGELGDLLGAGIIISIFLALLSIFLYTMATALQLRVSKGEQPNLDSLIEAGKKYFLPLFGLLLLMVLIIGVGLILLIVPGLFAIGRLIFAPYLLVEKNLGIIESLKASNELARGRAGEVWAAIGLSIIIGIIASIIANIPAIGPLIGTVITIAYSLVIVLRYQEIKKLPKIAE